jgi:DNA ligase, NAD-dependent
MSQGTPEWIVEEHKRLADLIRRADEAYHSGDEPIMEDAEYDSLKRRLVEIEVARPDLRRGSPSSAVGAKPRKGFAKVRHAVRMMSLDNAFTSEDVHAFVASVARATGVARPRFTAEVKIDGLSLSVSYRDGKLERAATRGDSEVGEDVTANVLGISGIPHEIPYREPVEIRGEVYMTRADLAELNARQAQAGQKVFANARNAAAGALRNVDPEKVRSRPLRFLGYSMIGGPELATQEEVLATLHAWGVAVSDLTGICEGAEELIAYQAHIASIRHEIPFDIDGVVYKLDDLTLRAAVGETSRAPKWATAHKFEAEKVTTQLLGITLQVGRTGVVTPVAELRPVKVGGVIVSRATLHNADFIKGVGNDGEPLRGGADIRVGDTVVIQRAGDVIPQVVDVILDLRLEGTRPYEFPNSCPSCGGALHREPGQAAIRCVATFACPAQKVERLCYLASREVLNIDGLGDKAIEAFVEAGILDRPGDVFRLRYVTDRIAALDGWAEKSAMAIAEAADAARRVPLWRFITALGIRHVGPSTAKLLAKKAVSASRFLEDCRAIAAGDAAVAAAYEAIDSVGSAVTRAIAEHFSDDRNVDDALDLADMMTIEEHVLRQGPLSGKTVVFTGSLERFDRKAAQASAEALGAKVSGSVSKRTHLVVAGPGAGSKLEEARRHGVPVIDEVAWIAMLEEAMSAAEDVSEPADDLPLLGRGGGYGP